MHLLLTPDLAGETFPSAGKTWRVLLHMGLFQEWAEDSIGD